MARKPKGGARRYPQGDRTPPPSTPASPKAPSPTPPSRAPWYRRALPAPGGSHRAVEPHEEHYDGTPPGVSFPGIQWFGFLGGIGAWAASLTLLYVLTEIDCHSQRLAYYVAGVPAVELLSYIITLLATFTAIAAAVLAYWSNPLGITGNDIDRPGMPEAQSRSRFMAYVGMLMSGLFAIATLANGLPFFFLRTCT